MRNGWMRFMWPTWPTVGFSADVAGQHAVAALAAAQPVQPQPVAVVVEQALDADLAHGRRRRSRSTAAPLSHSVVARGEQIVPFSRLRETG